ncbi:hypothetical protein VTL71DRAFT_366 [Oculimacula yallundae]|uniref:Ppe family protein n=1 Tax=Oculimacula yallundae TaxID=86028 RepID=A0ABR4CZT0_9HELO
MYSNYFLAVALFSARLNALPLNINLGAYSPALVVGDGEISFGGNTDVSNLMNALEGAAVSGAAKAATAPAQQQAPAAAVVPVVALTPQTVPEKGTQVTSLQGMGKEIAPRVLQLHQAAAKRDLQGFTAALNYASGALKTSPEIHLGTEESGIGILQKAGGAAPAAAKPEGAHKRRSVVNRDLFSPKMKTTITTMFVRRGPAARSEDSSVEKRELAVPGEKREQSSSAIDAVNLNMPEGAVAELTFVETSEVDDDEEE